MTQKMTTILAAKPGPLINMNNRGKWDRINGNIVWRDAAYWWAKRNRLVCRGAQGPVEVWIEFGTDQPNKKRDPHNFYPTIKAILDGFTRAAVWADDDSEHVRTFEPTFVDTITKDSLRITLAWEVAE